MPPKGPELSPSPVPPSTSSPYSTIVSTDRSLQCNRLTRKLFVNFQGPLTAATMVDTASGDNAMLRFRRSKTGKIYPRNPDREVALPER